MKSVCIDETVVVNYFNEYTKYLCLDTVDDVSLDKLRMYKVPVSV